MAPGTLAGMTMALVEAVHCRAGRTGMVVDRNLVVRSPGTWMVEFVVVSIQAAGIVQQEASCKRGDRRLLVEDCTFVFLAVVGMKSWSRLILRQQDCYLMRAQRSFLVLRSHPIDLPKE